MTRVVPVEPTLPGEYLQDELDARKWTHADLAEILGITRRQVVNLVSGKSGITPEIATLLAEAFGQEAQTWMNLQISYELAKHAQQDRSVRKRAAIYTKAPIRDMVRRGWISDEKDTDQLALAICRFLEIKKIDDDPEVRWAARRSGSYGAINSAQVCWYFRAKQLAECVNVAPYREDRFGDAVQALKALANNVADIRRVPRVLADNGIRFVVLQHLPGSKVDGAAFWGKNSPAIAMSLRYDRIDNFWFTLLHEMSHVKHHDESVDVEIMERDEDELPECEKRANKEAVEALISPEKMESFLIRNRPLFYQKRVIEFANARGIHPGIVVGQLHHRKEIEHYQLRGLLEKVKNELVGNALTDGWGDCPAIGG